MVSDDDVIRADGPWLHREVAANGSRFHIVEAGEGPLIVLLHGFPMFWWTWRALIPVLADNGYRVVAMDLRGYGDSDHPPHGYDPSTLAADVHGVIRCLGESQAIVMGHGWGGLVGWTLAAEYPDVVDGLITLNAPHPRRLRESVRRRSQRKKFSYVWKFQLPFAPERTFMRSGGSAVINYLRQWSLTSEWLTQDVAQRYSQAFTRWPTAHTAIEYHRWAVRSFYRTDGRRYMENMQQPITSDTLIIHGVADPTLDYATSACSEDFVSAPCTRIDLPVGHWPQEEDPQAVQSAVLTWLNERDARG